GAQPLSNENESIWVTFNGEIFNYLELASELSGLGHIFKTKSDTEVIVHAYEQWGMSCFEKFNGQWALALWDRKNEQVILSRDRLGIRPLYYTICQNRILFASEVKALFADKNVERKFDPIGFSEIITFWSPVAPRSVFKGIEELKPGHFAVVKNGNIKSKPYWTLSFPDSGKESDLPEKENANLLQNLLINASKIRFTRSDVPVGAYLSGGIDSSIVSSIVANYTEAPLKTFSIRFDDPEFDEGTYQAEMIKRLGSDHEDIVVSTGDIGHVFPDVVWHAERQILRTAPAPLFLLSRLVRESGYKVVVTVEEGDEVLAEYDIFREAKIRQFLARDPSSTKRQKILMRLYPWMERSPGKAPAFASLFFGKGLDPKDLGFSHRPRWDATSSLKHILNPDFRHETEKIDVAEEFLSKLPNSCTNWDLLCRTQWI
ncbi:MAG: asparagine synthase (glutamine-hydrolyzing), partial [Deltaproteobacteria bacterium]|nr:asparagine synthase (glutamine-hydrolyzing) [Deltaproteobacteria bacterium]